MTNLKLAHLFINVHIIYNFKFHNNNSINKIKIITTITIDNLMQIISNNNNNNIMFFHYFLNKKPIKIISSN